MVIGGKVVSVAVQSRLRYRNNHYRTHALLYYHLVASGKVVSAAARLELRYRNDLYRTHALYITTWWQVARW
jgi:hypothetical protein